jgi:hypothetical protein
MSAPLLCVLQYYDTNYGRIFYYFWTIPTQVRRGDTIVVKPSSTDLYMYCKRAILQWDTGGPNKSTGIKCHYYETAVTKF